MKWTRQLWRIANSTDLYIDATRTSTSTCSISSLYNQHRIYSAMPQHQTRADAEEDQREQQPNIQNNHSKHTIDTHRINNTQRISDWRKSLPSIDHFSKLLRPSPSSTPCSSSSPLPSSSSSTTTTTTTTTTSRNPSNKPTIDQPLHWRDIVQQAHHINTIHHHHDTSNNHVLTDTFGRKHTYLRISLTERCNLRCLYCMPEDGVDLTPHSKLLSVAEIERLVTLFASEGVTKVRLTGGEPTLRSDLTDIIKKVSSIDGIRDVCLTTNGITLKRKLKEYQDAGLTHLNISLDTLRSDRFELMTRRKGHDRVLSAIDHAVELGYNPVKVNVVVMRGVNDDELIDFVEMTRDKPINVRFIEYMPFDGNVWSSKKLVPYKEMINAIQQHYSSITTTIDNTTNTNTINNNTNSNVVLKQLNDASGEVAKNYSLINHRGTISFITSMTKAFCGDCNRLRLMADGNFKVCLFGNSEVSLRDAVREGASDHDLRAVISAAVNRKKAAHAGMFELAKMKNRPMVKIGG